MNNPFISVIMPVYNSVFFLNEAIESVINQEYVDWELICINDGSTDNSLDILNYFSSIDSRVKVISQENSGKASIARNKGLEVATGNYITMLDSDDKYQIDTLQLIVDRIKITKADFVLFNLCFWNCENNSVLSELLGINGDVDLIISGNDAFKLSLDWAISGCGAIQSQIIKRCLYDETDTNGDEFSTRVFFLNCKTVAFSKAKYFYRTKNYLTDNTYSIPHFFVLFTQYKLLKLIKDNDLTTIQFSTRALDYAISIIRLSADLLQVKNSIKSTEVQRISKYIDIHFNLVSLNGLLVFKSFKIKQLFYMLIYKRKLYFEIVVFIVFFKRRLYKCRFLAKN